MHKVLTSYGRMLACKTSGSRILHQHCKSSAQTAFARPYGTRLLIPSQQRQHALQRSMRAVGAMPEDLDSLLITRRALSGLDGPLRPLKDQTPLDSNSSSTTEGSSPSSISRSSSEGSISESSVDWEDVQAHKRAAVQQAFINNSLGFGFSAGGLVFPYYVGLVSSLVQHGVLSRPAQLAGSSAGSLIAASFNAGLDMETVERSMIDFGEDCLKNGTRYRLGPLLRDFLHNYLPEDAHEQCSGKTHVAVTRLLPYWRTQMVSHFESRDDLISALLTSCHIPWYFDGRWMTKFRGHYCVDGGVMAFIPTVPEVDYTVKVMCFPSSHLSLIKGATANSRRLKRIHSLVDIDITMDAFEEWPYDLQQVLKWALLASAQETSSLLIEKGKRDATAWFEAMELGPLVAQQQAQQQTMDASAAARKLQQQGAVILGSSSSSSSGQQGGVAGDWSDDRAHHRQAEAEQAHRSAAEAEAAVGGEGGKGGEALRGGDPIARAAAEELLQPASAASTAAADGNGDGGPSRAAIKHAAELEASGIIEPPTKRHKAAAAAATVAAAANAAADGVGSLLGGKQKQQQQEREE